MVYIIRNKIGREIEQEHIQNFSLGYYMSKKLGCLKMECHLLLSHFLHPMKGVMGIQTCPCYSLLDMSEGIYISWTWYILHWISYSVLALAFQTTLLAHTIGLGRRVGEVEWEVPLLQDILSFGDMCRSQVGRQQQAFQSDFSEIFWITKQQLHLWMVWLKILGAVVFPLGFETKDPWNPAHY